MCITIFAKLKKNHYGLVGRASTCYQSVVSLNPNNGLHCFLEQKLPSLLSTGCFQEQFLAIIACYFLIKRNKISIN